MIATVAAGVSVIVDFMSLIRKIGFGKNPKVRDAFDGTWGIFLAASNADRIEIVYDSYLEGSIKESTRIGRAKEESIEIINLNLDPPVSPEIRASSINKERLQTLSRNYFLMKGKERGKNVILSGYCIKQEADSRIVLRTACAAKKDFRQFLVLSNDTDVGIYVSLIFMCKKQ